MSFDISNYVTVADRLVVFYAVNPDGRIRCERPRIVEIGDRTFLEVVAHVYRTPDDRTPTIASAWEPFPGRTPYTRDSEAMNAETSAVGRALGLAGYGSTKSRASREEVQARQPGGLSIPVAKGRVLAAARGDQEVAREAWRIVFPDNPASIDVERLEAAENVARELAPDPEPEPPADPVAGLAAARKALEEVTE
jgi:hypothetical protein